MHTSTANKFPGYNLRLKKYPVAHLLFRNSHNRISIANFLKKTYVSELVIEDLQTG